jgi:ribonuclease HIII
MAKKKKDYEAHEAAIQSLREFASSKRWQLVEEREIDYGYQLVVFDGFTRNNVGFFPSGKIVIQGIPGSLKDELGRWREERTTAAVLQTGIVSLPFDDMPPIEKPVSVEQAVTVPIATFAARESIVLGVAGQDDYFGPLVISAIHVDAWAEAQFSMLGIQDGALLSDEMIREKAEEIKAICAHSLVAIGPARYNEAFGKVQRQDSVWAWGNVRAIENMLEKAKCEMVVARQFGDEAIIESALGKKGHQITLEQSTDSQVNIAVAVANILANAEYVRSLEQLAQRVGQKLLRGSSGERVIAVGREIVARGGKNALGEVAKLHFEVSQKIFQ